MALMEKQPFQGRDQQDELHVVVLVDAWRCLLMPMKALFTVIGAEDSIRRAVSLMVEGASFFHNCATAHLFGSLVK